jgi:hypothetical protein
MIGNTTARGYTVTVQHTEPSGRVTEHTVDVDCYDCIEAMWCGPLKYKKEHDLIGVSGHQFNAVMVQPAKRATAEIDLLNSLLRRPSPPDDPTHK